MSLRFSAISNLNTHVLQNYHKDCGPWMLNFNTEPSLGPGVTALHRAIYTLRPAWSIYSISSFRLGIASSPSQPLGSSWDLCTSPTILNYFRSCTHMWEPCSQQLFFRWFNSYSHYIYSVYLYVRCLQLGITLWLSTINLFTRTDQSLRRQI